MKLASGNRQKIEDQIHQNTLIKERDKKINKQENKIKKHTDLLMTAHLLLAGQCSDLSAKLISTLTSKRSPRTASGAAESVLTGQSAQKTEEVDTVTAQNARLRAEVDEIAKPRLHSLYPNIAVPRRNNAIADVTARF